MLAELVTRGQIVLLWLSVAIGVIFGELATGNNTVGVSSRSPRPRGLEWRHIRPVGRRLVAIRLQVILA